MLRSGGDFRPQHVQRLARQVPGLVCLSDVDVPGVACLPLKTDWPKWWAKLEVFGPTIDGDVMFYDLDTVVLSPLDMPTQTTVLSDFGRPELMGSGLMFVTAEDRRLVWDAFTQDPKGAMQANRRWPNWGDQGFLNRHIGKRQRWQEIAPGQVVSYKEHVLKDGLKPGVRVVCFHGKPRPWECGERWASHSAR